MMSNDAALKAKFSKVRGLDSIRFICAFFVLFWHSGILGFFTQNIDRSLLAGKIIRGIINNQMPGPIMVIAFFIISGFCIHYPHVNSNDFNVAGYLIRRYLRLGIPLIVVSFLAIPLNLNYFGFERSILWSLYAEIIYYTLYPILRAIKQKASWSWKQVLLIAYFFSFLVVLSNPAARDYPAYGVAWTWLLGLPCWLLGCQLAEGGLEVSRARVSMISIWKWRIIVIILASICSVLCFHSPIGYPWTLNFFAIVAFFWLKKEWAWFNSHPPNVFLEWGGEWSYSIYLVHLPAFKLVGMLFAGFFASYGCSWMMKGIQLPAALIICYLFYLCCEKPGHLLAKKLSLI